MGALQLDVFVCFKIEYWSVKLRSSFRQKNKNTKVFSDGKVLKNIKLDKMLKNLNNSNYRVRTRKIKGK